MTLLWQEARRLLRVFAVTAFLLVLASGCPVQPCDAATFWTFQVAGRTGKAEVIQRGGVTCACVDDIAKTLKCPLVIQGKKNAEEARISGRVVSLKLVRGASAVWIGYSAVGMSCRTRFEQHRWWIAKSAVPKIITSFLRKNGKIKAGDNKKAFIWRSQQKAAQKSQAPPAKRAPVTPSLRQPVRKQGQKPEQKPKQKPEQKSAVQIPDSVLQWKHRHDVPGNKDAVRKPCVNQTNLWPTGRRKKLVVIDAGHGGKDPGAISGRYQEKVIALQIARKLAEELRRRGVTIKMTRTGDTYPTLRERTEMANSWKADVFISVHLNALPKGRHARGMEIYIMASPTDEDAMELAKAENAELLEESAQKGKKRSKKQDRRTEVLMAILGNMEQNAKISESTELAEELFTAGQKSGLNMKRVAQAPFWVLRGAAMPAVLIETGFISERAEARLLATASYQTKMARAIANGVVDFIHR